jgi:outer membrane protein assembly factor BamB
MIFRLFMGFILIMFPVFALYAGGEAEPSASSLEVADWPHWRGPDWNSILSDAEWDYNKLSQGKILWQKDVGDSFSSVSVADRNVYTMGYVGKEEHVYCLDISNGEVVWDYTFPSRRLEWNGSRCTPTIEGKYVYALGQRGHLVCLNKNYGSVVWQIESDDNNKQQNRQWGYSSSPRIEGDILYINVGERGMAFNKLTGEKIWGESTGYCGYATPVLFEHNSNQYIAIFSYASLVIVHRDSGEIAYTYSWPTDYMVNAADPLIIDNMIFISSDYGTGSVLLEMKEDTLNEVWRKENDGSHFSSFVYKDGYIYGNFASAHMGEGFFICIDAKTGDYCWRKDYGVGSVLMADDKLILLNQKGEIIIASVDKTQYQELAKYQIEELQKLFWTPPVLCKGRLFVKNYYGNLYCIDVSK